MTFFSLPLFFLLLYFNPPQSPLKIRGEEGGLNKRKTKKSFKKVIFQYRLISHRFNKVSKSQSVIVSKFF